MSITILGFAGVTALMLSMLLMPYVSRLAEQWNVLDHPDDRKVHGTAIPSMGGVAFGAAFLAGCVLFIPVNIELAALLAGLLVILATGIADDVRQINPWLKLTGQILACAVFLIISGDAIDSFGDFLGIGQVYSGWLAVPLTVFCMVGIINAMNMADGLDGLACGLSLIACAFLAYFAIISQYWLNLYLLTILAGSLLGFLYFNFHPARIFMGDTGSMVLGYVLAAVCVLFQNVDDMYPVYPISLALVLGLPIHDTLFVMTRRMVRGGNPFHADQSHLHHRLLSLNISHPSVVSMMYLLMISYGVLAIVFQPLFEYTQFYLGVIYGVMVFGGVVLIQKQGWAVPAWLTPAVMGDDRFQELFRDLSSVMGRTVLWMGGVITAGLVLPVLFFPSIQSSEAWQSFMIAFVILLLYPGIQGLHREQWTHGLIYIAVFALLVYLNLFGPAWTPLYLQLMTVVVLLWVILKLLFKRHGDVVLTSGFEVLMIFIAWCLPTLLIEAMEIPGEVRRLILHSCLEAVPFLLATKIIMRRVDKAERYAVLSVAGIFVLIGVRQYISSL